MYTKKFIRNSANYQMLKDKGHMIQAEDLDLEFNALVNYVNDEICGTINNLSNQVSKETKCNKSGGYLLYNNQYGKKEWREIEEDDLPNNLLSKFKMNNDICSIVATNRDQSFEQYIPESKNSRVFMLNTKKNLVWSKITSCNIQEKSIKGKNIESNSIKLKHLKDNVTRDFLYERAISDRHIKNKSIEGESFKDNCIGKFQLTKDLLQKIQSAIREAKKVFFSPKTLESRHFKDGVIHKGIQERVTNANKTDFTFQDKNIRDYSLSKSVLIPQKNMTLNLGNEHIKPEELRAKHILDNSISLDNIRGEKKLTKETLHPDLLKILKIEL